MADCKAAESTLTRNLRALDCSYSDLCKYIGYSKDNAKVVACIPTAKPPMQIEDVVNHLNDICTAVAKEWESLPRNTPSALVAYNTNLASIIRILVNVTFLFDAAKYPQHERLPGLFVGSNELNEQIIHLCLSWVLELRAHNYKSNETGAILTNLVTLLHNYVSYEFAQSSKPFCKLFLSQRRLAEFLRALADMVVGKLGTDLVLRNSLQQVCVEFWNAIVNWNIVDEVRFSELRGVFTQHAKLKELLDFMLRRVDRKDEESIYFLTLLFDADDFIHRFIADPTFSEVRKKCLDTIFTSLTNVLTILDLKDNPSVLLLETLVSVAANSQGRALLLTDCRKQLIDLVALFVGKFETMIHRAKIDAEADEQDDQEHTTSTKKLFVNFFRLYGAVHDDDQVFVRLLIEHFSGSRGANKLKVHLQMFQANTLLKDNDSIDPEDTDKYYFLFLAFKNRVQAKEAEEFAAKESSGKDASVAPSALLSRSIVERFRSMHAGGFKLPFALACSTTFVDKFRALPSEQQVKAEEGGTHDMMHDDSAPAATSGDAEMKCGDDKSESAHQGVAGASKSDVSHTKAHTTAQHAQHSQGTAEADTSEVDTAKDTDEDREKGSGDIAARPETLQHGHKLDSKHAKSAAPPAPPAMTADSAEPCRPADQPSPATSAAKKRKAPEVSMSRAAETGAAKEHRTASLSGAGDEVGMIPVHDEAGKLLSNVHADKGDTDTQKGLKTRIDARTPLPPVYVSDDDDEYEDLSEPEFIDPGEWESETDSACTLPEGLVMHSRVDAAAAAAAGREGLYSKSAVKTLALDKPKTSPSSPHEKMSTDASSNVGGDGAHGSAIPLAGAAARGARTDDANCTHPPVNQSLPSKESVSSKDLLPRSNVVSVTAAVSQESKPASVMKAKVVPKSASKGGTGSAGAKSAAHDAMKSSGSIKDSMPAPTSPDFAQQDMLKLEAARMVSSGLAAKGKLPTDSIPESEQIRAQQLQQQQHIQQQQQNLHLQHIEYQRQQQHQAHQAHLAQHHHQHQLQQLQLHAQQEHLQQQQQQPLQQQQQMQQSQHQGLFGAAGTAQGLFGATGTLGGMHQHQLQQHHQAPQQQRMHMEQQQMQGNANHMHPHQQMPQQHQHQQQQQQTSQPQQQQQPMTHHQFQQMQVHGAQGANAVGAVHGAVNGPGVMNGGGNGGVMHHLHATTGLDERLQASPLVHRMAAPQAHGKVAGGRGAGSQMQPGRLSNAMRHVQIARMIVHLQRQSQSAQHIRAAHLELHQQQMMLQQHHNQMQANRLGAGQTTAGGVGIQHVPVTSQPLGLVPKVNMYNRRPAPPAAPGGPPSEAENPLFHHVHKVLHPGVMHGQPRSIAISAPHAAAGSGHMHAATRVLGPLPSMQSLGSPFGAPQSTPILQALGPNVTIHHQGSNVAISQAGGRAGPWTAGPAGLGMHHATQGGASILLAPVKNVGILGADASNALAPGLGSAPKSPPLASSVKGADVSFPTPKKSDAPPAANDVIDLTTLDRPSATAIDTRTASAGNGGQTAQPLI